mmetsp:Transcript_16437/g.22763  ORF Transcript_16437/g.22763 Transcript_16437/m.22763 type:complete len:455 (+) Transcript_16437:58-1422(+)
MNRLGMMIVVVVMSVMAVGVVRGDSCASSQTLTVREDFSQTIRIPATGCKGRHCGGDVYMGENFILSPAGRREGHADSICTVMPSDDRAVCRWTLYFHDKSQIQLLGISFPHVANASDILVMGGSGKYLGVVGSGTTFVSPQLDHRMFELTLCFPEDGYGSGCKDGAIYFSEKEPITDVIVPAQPGYFTIGLMDMFQNDLSFPIDNAFDVTSGKDDGLCTFIAARWVCSWNFRLPDEDNKIFLMGSVLSSKDQVAVVPLIGGTGMYADARGNATVIARQALHQNSYYWEMVLSFKYGCAFFGGNARVSFHQTVGNSQVIPSKVATTDLTAPGTVRIFQDELRIVPNSRKRKGTPPDGIATGTCTMMDSQDRHYCEWVIQYPLDSSEYGKGTSQITMVGTVSDSLDSFSTIAVTGGTGHWNGAHGWGTYVPMANPVDDSDQGSSVASFEIEFIYF